MTKLGYMLFYASFIIAVGLFGSAMGLSNINGLGDTPTELSLIDWSDTVDFFMGMLTFSIPDAGVLSIVFYLLTIGFIWVIVETIRGV